MSEEKKKKKKKKAIIAGIIGSVALIGVGVGGIIATIPETEAKNEEENEEEKKKPPSASPKSQPISKVELATVLPQNQRNLGTIETNGALQPTVAQIQTELSRKSIDISQVQITLDSSTQATVSAKTGANAKYKGNVEVTYTVDSKVELATVLPQNQRNLGTIETNGALQPTVAQIQTELSRKSIDISQVQITLDSSTQATVSAKTGANAKYKGNVEVTYTVDSKVELATVLPQNQRNLGTIETNGALQPTVAQIQTELSRKSIDISQVQITLDSSTQATVSAKTGANAKYKGNVEVTYTVDSKVELATVLPQNQRNLGTIETNGALQPTVAQIQTELSRKSIDISQVQITLDSSTQATVSAKTGANAKYKGNVEVTYTVDSKVELATVLPQNQRNLGTIETNGALQPTVAQIQTELSRKSIDISQVQITLDSSTQATVSAKTGANAKYKGNVEVTYTVDSKVELATVLPQNQRNLGTIETNGALQPTVAQIQTELSRKSIDISQVQITLDSSTQATVSAKTGANAKYKGNVEVTYTVDSKVELATVLPQNQRNLGTIETNGALQPTVAQIQTELSRKSIDISQVQITLDSSTQATVSAKTGANAKYKGNVEVTYTVDSKVELATVLPQNQRNLGTIETNGALQPTVAQIQTELSRKSIDISQVQITLDSSTQATVSAKTGANAKYKGNVEVTYTVDSKVELATVLPQNQRNLGTIETNGALQPTVAQIQTELSRKSIDISQVQITLDSSTQATVSAKTGANAKYKGNVEVTYTVDSKVELATVLPQNQRNLGTIETNGALQPTVAQIQTELSRKSIDISQVQITLDSSTQATVSAKTGANAKYKGNVEVTYTVDSKVELATVLPQNQRNLGTIETNGALQPTVAQIQTELSRKSIDISQVQITLDSSTQATVSAKTGANAKYKGNVEVTYTVDSKVELATVLPQNQRNLGTIETNGALQPTVAQIQTELSRKSIDISQVQITLDSSTQATVSAKTGANAKYKGNVEVTYTVDSKVELATVLPQNQRNLGTIETNGALQPTVAQIQTELSRKSIDISQVQITLDSSTQATVSAKTGANAKYKGNVEVTYTVDSKVELATVLPQNQRNLGTIETNGALQPTVAQIQTELSRKSIDISQVQITLDSSTQATVSAKTGANAKYKGNVEVTYTVDSKVELATVLPQNQRNLGTIETNGALQPTVAQIQTELSRKSIDISQVQITLDSSTQATVSAKTGANAKYKGNVEVTYTVDSKVELATVLPQNQRNLGTIETNGALQPTVAQIQTELSRKSIDISQVQITLDSSTQATVSAKTGANAKYKGNVEVTYTVDSKVELATVLPQNQRNLGTIETNGALQPTVAQIQTELSRKSIDISQVQITLDSSTQATVSAKTGANAKYKGNVEVTYTVDSKVELATVLPQNQRNLGTIETNGALQPTVAQIQTELSRKSIDISQVQITLDSSTQATVSAKTGANAKYKGNVEVTYTVDSKVELATVLPQNQRNLGTIETNGALQPTVAQIQTELSRKSIDISQVQITLDSSTQATVSAKTGANAKYKGNVEVTYTVDSKVELATVLPQNQRNLGTIETNGALQPTVAQIQTELSRKSIDISQVQITLDSSTQATVSAKTGANAKYKGNVEVTYTVDSKVELATVLPQNQRNLGTIETNGALQPTVAQIQTELSRKSIDISQVQITLDSSTQATVSAKTGANAKYKGNVEVTYTVDSKVELATVLPQNQRNLGTIETNGALQPTVAQIQTELSRKSIDISQVQITLDSSTQATVSAKTGANAKYKGNVEVTYTVDSKVELATVLPQNQRNLGTIETNGALQPTVAQIQTELSRKSIDISQVQITLDSSTQATVSAKTGANAKYKGNVEVTYTVDSKVELATVLPQNQRNLGTIETNGALQPTVAQIQTELSRKSIDISQVQITLDSSTQATVSAKTGANAKYKGNVEVTYTVDSKVELATVLPQNQRNLGTIETNGALQPTVAQIQTELSRKSIDISQVQITLDSSTQATVSAKTGANAKYKGNVEVTYTVDSKVELATVLPQNQRNLGTIETNGALQPTVAQIQTELSRKSIDISQVQITLDSSTQATVSAKTGANAKYKGNVEVTYTVDSKVELATVLPQNQRNLGTIETNGALQPTVAQIQTELSRKSIDISQVQITLDSSTQATVSAKTGANAKYKGNVEVTYTVDSKVELATVLPQNQRNLGTIETNGALQPTVAQIQTELSRKSIDISQVQITLDSSTQATVSAKTGANAKYKGNVEVTYTVDSKVELATAQSDVWSLATDNNGNIYAGDKNGNVYKNGQKIININFSVWSLATDNNGNIYAGTLNGKIYKINTSQSKWSKTEVHDLKLQVTSLATDNNGNIYAGDKNGNVYKNGQKIININSVVREIIIDNNGNIYVGTLNGKIYKINTSQSKWSKTEVHDLKLQVTSLATDNNGNIYVGTLNGKIYKINTSQSKWSKTEVHDLKLQVTSLATDNNGNIYAGTLNGKIYKWNGNLF